MIDSTRHCVDSCPLNFRLIESVILAVGRHRPATMAVYRVFAVVAGDRRHKHTHWRPSTEDLRDFLQYFVPLEE